MRPCLLCANVFLGRETRGIVAADTSNLAVHHYEGDFSKFTIADMRILLATVNRLEEGATMVNAGSMTKTDFNELTTRLGWNWDDGLRSRLSKAPPHIVLKFDWMHTLFVGGVFNVHVAQLIRCLKGNLGVGYDTLHAYLNEWTWPVAYRNISKDACSPARAKSSWEADVFKCQASEGLCYLPVCKCFRTCRRGCAGCVASLRRLPREMAGAPWARNNTRRKVLDESH